MTAPEPGPAPAASGPAASASAFGHPTDSTGLPRRYGDARYGMSLVAVIVGTYALISAPISQVSQIILSRQLDVLPLVVGQIAFAAVIVLFAVLVAPTSGARRGVAAAIVVIALIVVNAVLPAYYTGALRLPPVISYLLGPAFLFTLAASAAWLTLRERHGVAYVFLAATLVIPFALYGLVFAGRGSAFVTPVQNVLVTVVGVGIAWAGWAVSRRSAPAHPRP